MNLGAMDAAGRYGYTRRQISTSGRATPSAAVMRALQVLDESYQHQGENKRAYPWKYNDKLTMSRRGRSPSPFRSNTPSPVRKLLRDSPTFDMASTPPKIIEIERDNLQDALGDSESRRNVLLRKLAETQRTMEIQNDAVRSREMELAETKATTKLLQQLQGELETKVEYLEKEKGMHMTRQIQDAEEKEALRREADSFQHEIKRLQCLQELHNADNEEYHREMDRAREDIKNARDENRKLIQDKSAIADEAAALRDNLLSAKRRMEVLENKKEHAYTEMQNLQESQKAILARNTELSERIDKAENSSIQLRNMLDETEMAFQSTKHDFEACTEKYNKQGYKLAELQTTHKDVRSDFERSIRYTSELERTILSIKTINQELKKSKVTLEDNLTRLHADLAKSRLDFSRTSEEKSKISEELDALKKVHKGTASDLSEVRRQFVTKKEELLQAEAARKIDGHKIELLKTQMAQGDGEIDQLSSHLASLQQRYDDLKIQADENFSMFAKETRGLKADKDKAESKYKDAEMRLERTNLELTAVMDHGQSQLDHWRDTCTKLTILIEERDRDHQEVTCRLRASEEATDRAESQIKSLQIQVADVHALHHEVNELKNDNKRLAKECKENHQMIAVLEMERDVLAKSPSKSSGDGLGEEVKKLQVTLLGAIDKITTTDILKERLEKSDETDETKGLQATELALKRAKESNKLLGDQLIQVQKEAESMHNLMEARNDTHERETKKMERERDRLEDRLRSLEEEARVLRSSLATTAKSPTQFPNIEQLCNLKLDQAYQDLKNKEQQYMFSKGQLVVALNAKKSAEDKALKLESQIKDLKEELSRPGDDIRFAGAQQDIPKLQRELQTKTTRLEAKEADAIILKSRLEDLCELREKQENIIKTLRRQLKEAKEKLQKMENGGEENEEITAAEKVKVASVRSELERAFADIAMRDEQLAEMRKNLILAQKLEQKARQERDELKGKTIIMESITDSSTELRKQLDQTRQENLDLEKQMNAIMKSKPSQTPHPNIALGEDFDNDMEKQYSMVCERNKWLENRISSLLHEIDLLRDQNSLLLQEKNSAERQASATKIELKSVSMTSKSSQQQRQLEQIHLQNSNAEKMHQILEMQRELREKNQIIQAMSKQLESSQKKSDKKMISAFMKKLKKSTNTGQDRSRSAQARTTALHTSSTEPIMTTLGTSSGFDGLPLSFPVQTFTDTGYSTMSLPAGRSHLETQENSCIRSGSVPYDTTPVSDVGHRDQAPGRDEYRPRSALRHSPAPDFPVNMKGLSPSPTLTMSARRTEYTKDDKNYNVADHTSDSVAHLETSSSVTHVLADPVRRTKKKDRPDESATDEDQKKDDYTASGETEGSRERSFISHQLNRSEAMEFSDTKLSQTPTDPEFGVPSPVPAPVLPTPASSPSVLSPTSARNPPVRTYASEASDRRSEEEDT